MNNNSNKSDPQRILFAGIILGGPLPTYFFKLLKTLAYRRYTIFYLNRGVTPEGYSNESDVCIIKWGSIKEKRGKDFLSLLSQIRRLRPTCVISCFDAINKLTFLSWLLGVKHRIILHNHTQVMNRVDSKKPSLIYKLYHYWTKLNYRLATKVIAVSNGSVDDMKKYFTKSKPLTTITHLMEDPQQRYLPDIPEQSGFYITFIGRLETSKDQFVAIRALSLILPTFPDLQLKILGDGSKKDELIAYTEQYGVSQNCQFFGYRDHNTIFSVLKHSRLNLCTSIDEAFGLVNIEALGMGVPIIGTNVGGIKDIIKEGYNGYLIDIGDEEQLGNRMLKILNDNDHQRNLSKQARKDFEEHYLLSEDKLYKQARQIEELLKR